MTYQLNHIDPDQIDSLRLKAFKTNDPYDTMAYYRAASAYFQDRHVREMNRADLATPLDDPRVKARSDAIHEFCEKAGLSDAVQVAGLPDDVRAYRRDSAVAYMKARAALSALEKNK